MDIKEWRLCPSYQNSEVKYHKHRLSFIIQVSLMKSNNLISKKFEEFDNNFGGYKVSGTSLLHKKDAENNLIIQVRN